MANQLYEELRNVTPQNDFFSRLQQFKQTFRGNPQEQVQNLLRSGKVSQQQYNRAVQMAQQLQKILNIK